MSPINLSCAVGGDHCEFRSPISFVLLWSENHTYLVVYYHTKLYINVHTYTVNKNNNNYIKGVFIWTVKFKDESRLFSSKLQRQYSIKLTTLSYKNTATSNYQG